MQPIEMRRIRDEEGDRNRGWQVDRVGAFVDGVEVGYLKISYIPNARFNDHYGAGVLSYMDKIQGHGLFERPADRLNGRADHNIDGFADEQLRTFVRRASWIVLHKDYSMSDELATASRTELMGLVNQMAERAEAQHGKAFRAFKVFHVDKPLVDFIRVDNFRRQGIATALHAEGARWMESLGMRLHRSGVETNDGRHFWDSLVRRGWTIAKGKRCILDSSKIDEPLFA